MLPKHSRLTKQTIETYLIRARRLKTSRFLILYTLIPGSKRPQVSISSSKKVAPKAVIRAKLRRRGYAAVRPLVPFLKKEAALLVSYTSNDVVVPIAELTSELREGFRKTGLLS